MLDTFRGFAVLLMIQGHTFTALAQKSSFSGGWVRLYTLFHGLTAPMFLMGGGLAYGMVSGRRREQSRVAGSSPAPFEIDARIMRRGLVLITLGYLLQWPHVPLWRLAEHPVQFRTAFAVGPLQLVGLCLILCELTWGILRSRRAFTSALALGVFAIAACSPWVWLARRSTRLLPPWGMWFDGYGGSLFPFFPWAAFFFLGVLASGLVPFARRVPWAAASGLLGVGLGCAWAIFSLWAGGERLSSIYGTHEFWHANPMYLGFRSLLVLAFLGALIALEPVSRALRRRFPRSSGLFDVLSRQSLVAYVTHLLLLYGTPFTTGLVRCGRVFDLAEASVITLFIASYTLAIAVLWEHVKPADLAARALRRLRRREVDGVRESEGNHVAPPEQALQSSSTVHHG